MEVRDVFFSYARADLEVARPIVSALRQAGLCVWFDEESIETHEAITRSVETGVAISKALVALYSPRYPTRRACQWELTAAMIAAERAGHAGERVLVLNSARDQSGNPRVDHIVPTRLQDRLFAVVPDEPTEMAKWSREEADRIVTLVNSITAPLGELGVSMPRQVPQRLVAAPEFVGRLSDLWEVHDALFAGDAVQITGASGGEVASLAGIGGIGKSLLAQEYALRFGAAFPGGIFWLKASETHQTSADLEVAERATHLDDRLLEIAQSVGIHTEGLTAAEIRGRLEEHLAGSDRALWVVDDLPTGLAAEEARKWAAPSPTAKTLITTRDRKHSLGVRVDLDRLSQEEGYTLLTAQRQPQGESETEAARRIVEDLGGHPLALAVAGHELEHDAGLRSIADFEGFLRNPTQDGLELAAQLDPHLPNGHEPSIATTMLRGMDRLEESGRDVLRIAALMAPAPIPKQLLADVLTTADRVAEGEARSIVKRAVDATNGISLTSYGDTQRETILVHALVVRTSRFYDRDHQRASKLRAAAMRSLANTFSVSLEQGAYDLLVTLVPHARELARYDDGKPTYLERESSLDLREQVGAYDWARGDYTLARAQLDDVAARRRKGFFGKRDPSTARALARLVTVLVNMGDLPAARVANEQLRQTVRSRWWLGPRNPDRVVVLANEASITHAEGNFARARGLQERVLEMSRRLFGEKHAQTLIAMNNLGLTLAFMNQHDQALPLQEEGCALARELFGEEHPQTLTLLNNLAITLSALDEDTRAHEIRKTVYEVSKRVRGDDHPETLKALGNLTLSERSEAQGIAPEKLTRILMTQQHVWEGRRESLGDDHLETLIARRDIAHTKGLLGDIAGARDAWRALFADDKRILHLEHPETLDTGDWFAEALVRLGEFSDALAVRQEVLAGRRERFGEEDSSTLAEMLAIGDILSELNRWAEARALQQQAVDTLERVAGASDAITLAGMASLATTLDNLQEYEAARDYKLRLLEQQRRALELQLATSRPYDPALARLLRDLGGAYVSVVEPGLATTTFEWFLEVGNWTDFESPTVKYVLEQLEKLAGHGGGSGAVEEQFTAAWRVRADQAHLRRCALEGADLSPMICDAIGTLLADADEQRQDDLLSTWGITVVSSGDETHDHLPSQYPDAAARALEAYARRTAKFGEEIMRKVERYVILQALSQDLDAARARDTDVSDMLDLWRRIIDLLFHVEVTVVDETSTADAARSVPSPSSPSAGPPT